MRRALVCSSLAITHNGHRIFLNEEKKTDNKQQKHTPWKQLQSNEKKNEKKVGCDKEPSSLISHAGTTSSQSIFSSQIGRDVEDMLDMIASEIQCAQLALVLISLTRAVREKSTRSLSPSKTRVMSSLCSSQSETNNGQTRNT